MTHKRQKEKSETCPPEAGNAALSEVHSESSPQTRGRKGNLCLGSGGSRVLSRSIPRKFRNNRPGTTANHQSQRCAVSDRAESVSREKTQNVVDVLDSHLDVVVMFYVNTSSAGLSRSAIPRSKLLHRKSMLKKYFWRSLCKTCGAVELFVALAFAVHAQTPTAQLAPAQITSDVHAATVQPTRASFGAPAEKLKIAGVPNAGKISDSLYRGAQPSTQGLAELKKLGVTTIVDLRGNRGPVAQERAQAEALGLRFVDIPMSGWSAPSTAQVSQFLKLLRDDPTKKVFVHCYYGADRTGVMIAAYRIAQQNWTADQAIAEMYSFGFHYRWHPSMKNYVHSFPARLSGDAAFAWARNPEAADRGASAGPH